MRRKTIGPSPRSGVWRGRLSHLHEAVRWVINLQVDWSCLTVCYSDSVCYYKDLCIMSYLETVDICGRKTDSTPAIICSKFLQSIWQTSLLKQTALYLILFLYLSSVLQHPLIFFTLFCFLFFSENDETGVMDSLLEALQSGAAFRDRRKRAPRPRGESHILTSIYTETKTHTWNLVSLLAETNCRQCFDCSQMFKNNYQSWS